MKIDVSFVIIEFHSLLEVMDCVKSIHSKCKKFTYEIIISSNSNYELIKQKSLQKNYPNLVWRFNYQNKGFAYGMNNGIKLSNGEFIVIQNPDSKIINNKLLDAIKFLKKNNSIGLIGPQIINSSNEVQDSCREFISPLNLLKRVSKRFFTNKKNIVDNKFNYKIVQEVDWVIGGFMLFPRKIIEKVGMLSEDYFMYVEDMDFCYRIRKYGFSVFYFPNLVVKYEGDRKSSKHFFLFNKYFWIHLVSYLKFFIKSTFDTKSFLFFKFF